MMMCFLQGENHYKKSFIFKHHRRVDGFIDVLTLYQSMVGDKISARMRETLFLTLAAAFFL